MKSFFLIVLFFLFLGFLLALIIIPLVSWDIEKCFSNNKKKLENLNISAGEGSLSTKKICLKRKEIIVSGRQCVQDFDEESGFPSFIKPLIIKTTELSTSFEIISPDFIQNHNNNCKQYPNLQIN